MRRRPVSTLFPYTTLFRSVQERGRRPMHDSDALLQKAQKLVAVAKDFGLVRLQKAELGQRGDGGARLGGANRSEEHTSELQSLRHLVCRLLLEKKNKINQG